MTFAYRFTEISFLYFPNQSVHGDAAVWRKVDHPGFSLLVWLSDGVLISEGGSVDESWF